MLTTVLKFAAAALVGIMAYNYFFGTEGERAQSEALAKRIGEVGKAGADLFGTEYQKFRAGKYDDALDKIARGIQSAKDAGHTSIEHIQAWEAKYDRWKESSEELQAQMKAVEGHIPDALKVEAQRLAQEGEALERAAGPLKEKS